MILLHTSSAAQWSGDIAHSCLNLTVHLVRLKDSLSHYYGKMYLNPDGHISTCQSTQNHKDTHICTHPSSQNCKVILHTCDPITSKRKPHISGTTSGIHLPHLHSHWVWCLWYGCVMGFDYHNTTSTPKRQTNFFPFYLV